MGRVNGERDGVKFINRCQVTQRLISSGVLVRNRIILDSNSTPHISTLKKKRILTIFPIKKIDKPD